MTLIEKLKELKNKKLKKDDSSAKKKIKDPRGEPIPVPKDPTLKDK